MALSLSLSVPYSSLQDDAELISYVCTKENLSDKLAKEKHASLVRRNFLSRITL